MNYVLVSLVGDEATRMNDEFARQFAAEHPPMHAFHAEHPDHDLVAASVRKTKLAIVMGHDGGGSLRAASKGEPWVTPDEFANIFRGARVWAYACDTRSATIENDLVSFGRHALAGGVSVFAGHASPITAPPTFSSLPALRKQTYLALARGFPHFLLGSNSANEIRNHALKNRGPASANALVALSVQDAFNSLRILL